MERGVSLRRMLACLRGQNRTGLDAKKKVTWRGGVREWSGQKNYKKGSDKYSLTPAGLSALVPVGHRKTKLQGNRIS